jgi:hypothetical protein
MKQFTSCCRRLLLVLGGIGLLCLAGAWPGFATSATGSQNPDVTVFVTLTPDSATAGTTVVQTYAVTNNTRDVLVAVVTRRLLSPNGLADAEPLTVAIRPGEGLTQTQVWPITSDHAPGVYELAVAVTNAHGTSRATARFTVD